MASDLAGIVKIVARELVPAYQMVRISGYKQFPSANIVMWVMNDRALNKHATRATLGLVQQSWRAYGNAWNRKWLPVSRGDPRRAVSTRTSCSTKEIEPLYFISSVVVNIRPTKFTLFLILSCFILFGDAGSCVFELKFAKGITIIVQSFFHVRRGE